MMGSVAQIVTENILQKMEQAEKNGETKQSFYEQVKEDGKITPLGKMFFQQRNLDITAIK